MVAILDQNAKFCIIQFIKNTHEDSIVDLLQLPFDLSYPKCRRVPTHAT